MKILFLATDFNWPPVKGYQRIIAKYLECVSDVNEVDFISLNTNKNISKTLDYLRRVKCSSFDILNQSIFRRVLGVLCSIYKALPLQVGYYNSHAMNKLVCKYTTSKKYDIIFCTLVRSVQFVPEDCKKFTVVNLIDPMYFSYIRSLNWKKNFFYRAVFSYEANLLRKYEGSCLPSFSRSLLISDSDIDDYSKLYKNVNFSKSVYGVDVKCLDADRDYDSKTILISGNMGYEPNVDGVIHFVKYVLPIVWRSLPDLKLFIVGDRPSKKIINLQINQKIIVTGYVDDVRSYIQRSAVSICPIRLGVGIQTKVLEAMALGVPVVATIEGNSGIGAINNQDIIEVSTIDEMANSIVKLVTNTELNAKIGRNGIEFVKKSYTWENCKNNIDEQISYISCGNLKLKNS